LFACLAALTEQEQPSERLMEYARACDPNPMPEIQARVASLVEKIAWSSEAAASSGSTGSKIGSPKDGSGRREDQMVRTRRLGQALYYDVLQVRSPHCPYDHHPGPPAFIRISSLTFLVVTVVMMLMMMMQNMLDKETKRLRTKSHIGLFKHDVFHRALLACCLEVVLKANSLVTLAFPKILELFQIEALDFFKVSLICDLTPFLVVGRQSDDDLLWGSCA